MLTNKQLDTLRAYFQDDACPLSQTDFIDVWNLSHTSTEDSVQTWEQVCENYMDLYKDEPARACEYLLYSFRNNDLPVRSFENYTYIIDSYGYIVERDAMSIIDFDDDYFIQELYDNYNITLCLDDILENN